MITKEEFDRVQTLISNHSKTKNETSLKDLFPYKETLFCAECGSSITAERKKRVKCDCGHRFSALKSEVCPKCELKLTDMKSPKVENRVYYRCTKRKKKNCTQKSYTSEKIETIIKNILENLTLPKEFKELGLNMIKIMNHKENTLRDQTSNNLSKEIKKIEKNLNILLDLLMSNSIDSETYKYKKELLISEKSKIKNQLSRKNNKEIDNKINNYIDFGTELLNIFENASLIRKKLIFNALGSNQQLLDGKLVITKGSVLYHLLKIAKIYRGVKSNVRTTVKPYFIREKAPFQVLDYDLLHAFEEFRTVLEDDMHYLSVQYYLDKYK